MIVTREPEHIGRWHLAFHLKTGNWKHEWLIPGRFSHVSAFTYSFLTRTWVLIDFTPRRTTSVVLWPPSADELDFPGGLAKWTANCGILAADVRCIYGFRLQFGLTCVAAIKQITGVRSRALTPDGLWRDLIAAGATLVHDPDLGAGAAARPATDGAA